MFYKNKKKIISGILIVMIVALAGLVTNKYFNFDRYNNKIEVSNVKVTSRAVSSGNLTKTEKINGYDIINYTIKYKLESVDKEVIHNRIAIVEATLTDEENKYVTWNNVSLDNVSSEIINSGKTLKLTINNVTTNEEGAVKVKLNVTGAPNGFSVNPSVTVYEKDSAINETTVTARSIVETNSISGYVINKTVDKYEKNVELKLCKMESGLCTNSKTVYSNNDGSYSFSDLENGTYNISLVNNSGYTLVNDLNSIIINNEGKNINVEVINKANSDVTISKYIKKVIVTENGKTKTYDYGKIDKAVVAVKNMKNATAKIIYGFDISNKSDKARYIKVVKENIPDGLEYDETDSENSNWVNKKGILYNKTLANEAIKPGETRTLSISLKTKNSVTAQNYINNVSMTSENYYTVRYIVDGETVKEMMVLDSDTAVDYKYTKEDYDFIGWYKSSDYKEKFDFTTPIDHDVDLYGKLEEQNKVKYKVTYKLEDGTILETKEVTEGKTIPKIEAPVKKGYDFVGFRLPNETEEFDYSTKIYEDTTLIAIYKKKEYKVVFVDGDNENIQKVLYDEKVQKPADPEKELFTFLYWSLSIDGEEFDFETKVTENIKLYAVYKQAYYSVSFVLNDKVINDKVEVGTLLNEPEVELAEQYEKIEWYDENNNIVSFPLALTKNTTLYAKYITKKFDVKFISDGEDLQNIKVEYGKQIEKPNDPIVEGKKFKYWSLSIDGEKFDFGAQIKENITLYAVFDKITYTVKYMNLNDDGTYTQIGNTYKLDYDSDLPLIDNPEKEGYTFKGWSKEKNGEILNLPIKVRENITLYSVYTINEYTVTFHNEENVDKVKVNYNNVVTEPEKPTSSNPLKEFKWWSLKEDGEKFDFETKITKNIDLYAVYTGNMYTITFINGEDIKTKKYEAGSLISEPEVNEKEGYTFKYWSIYENGKDLEGNKSEFNFLLTPVENNLTLYAYYEANQMTVEFYNEDEVSKTLTVGYNSVINQSDIPTVTKNGYTFTGWYEKDSEDNYLDVSFDFTKAIKKNIKLYAKYEKLPNGVIFNDENRLESVNVEYGQTTNPIESKGKEGYTFKYWSLDKVNTFDFSSPITSTITLYAVYEINNYSVKFMNMNSDGTYTQLGDTYTISYNGEMPQIENPTLTGYEFKGWSLEENGDVVVLPTVVTKDVTYYAVYNHIKYDITFMSNNEKYGETQKLYYGDKITIPENPEALEGKVFKHWSLTENGDAYDLTTPVTGDLTLYAVFDVKKVKVTFMNQVSDALYEEYDVKDVLYGNALSDYPSNPTREGYVFKYWSLEENGEEYTPSVLKKDVTLYAVYEKEKVKVSFINNDSKYIDDVVIESGSTVTKPDSPSNTDTKIFKYWSLSIDGEEFDFNTKITSNITLYAVYKENTVTITFGNCNIEPITINYNSQIENMPNADTKEGYTFAYWSTSETGLDEENNELRFNVQSNIIENITLYAIYTHDSYTVTFGNSSIESQTIYYGDKVTKPNDPTGEYPFLYWSTSENGLDADGNRLEFDFNTIVKSDINLYAIYQVEKYTITFMVDGAIYGDIQYVNINEKITVPEDPTKEGNTFKYWSLEENGEAYDVETEITSSIILYAVFKPNTYNVSFEFNGQLYEKQTVDYGDLAKEPTTKPSKEYYIFDGWYLNDVKYDFNTKITDNIILNAKFNKIETPVIEISPLSWTKDSVTVTITGPEGYTIKYKKASEEYTEYTGAFEVSENTSITARLEKDGVISEEVTKNVENIDKLSPSVEKLIVSSVLQNSFLVNIKSTDTVSGIKSIKIYLNDIEEPIKIYTYEENSENKTNTVSETYKVENLDGNSYTIVEGTTYKVKAVVEDFAGNIVNSDEVEVTTKNENYKAAEITSLQGETLETPTQYSTLQDALDACPDSGKCTVSLLDDLNESVEVYDTKDITMDLNGKTLTGVRDNTIINYGKLNVINNTLDSESNPIGGIVSDDTAIKTTGTLQLGENDDSVTLSPSISGTSIGIDNTGTLKFYDGTIKGKNALKSTTIAKTPSSYNIVSITNNGIQSLTLGTIDDPEARINNIYFDKLSQAISTANNEDTVKLLKNVTVDSQMVTDENQTFTFDMNGYSIDGTTTYTDAEYDGLLVNKGNMTLTDTSDDVVKGDSVDKEKYDYDISDKFVSDGEYSFDYENGVLTSNNKDTEYGQAQEDDGKTYYKNQSTGYIKLDLTQYTGKYVVSFDTHIDGTSMENAFAEINESTERVRYENLTSDKILDIYCSSQTSLDPWYSSLQYRYKYIAEDKTVTKVLEGGKIYYLHIGFVRRNAAKEKPGGPSGKNYEYTFGDFVNFSNFQIYQNYEEGTSVIGKISSTKTYVTNLNKMTFNGIHVYGNLDSKLSSNFNYKYGVLEQLSIGGSSNFEIQNGTIKSIVASEIVSFNVLGGTISSLSSQTDNLSEISLSMSGGVIEHSNIRNSDVDINVTGGNIKLLGVNDSYGDINVKNVTLSGSSVNSNIISSSGTENKHLNLNIDNSNLIGTIYTNRYVDVTARDSFVSGFSATSDTSSGLNSYVINNVTGNSDASYVSSFLGNLKIVNSNLYGVYLYGTNETTIYLDQLTTKFINSTSQDSLKDLKIVNSHITGYNNSNSLYLIKTPINTLIKNTEVISGSDGLYIGSLNDSFEFALEDSNINSKGNVINVQGSSYGSNFDNQKITISNSTLTTTAESDGLYLSSYFGSFTMNDSNIIYDGTSSTSYNSIKGIYTRGPLNLKSVNITGFNTGIYLDCYNSNSDKLSTFDNVTLKGTGTGQTSYYGIYTSTSINVKNSKISNYYYGVYNALNYYTAGTPTLNINKTNIDETIYGIWTRAICNIGESDKNVTKDFKIYGSSASVHGEKYSQSHTNGTYTENSTINFYDGILSQNSLSQVKVDNIEEGFVLKKEVDSKDRINLVLGQDEEEKPFGVSDKEYGTLDTAIDAAMDAASPKTSITPTDAEEKLKKTNPLVKIDLSEFVSDGEYSFDYNDNKLVSNNKGTETKTGDDNKFINQSTGYIKLDLSKLSGKYDFVVDHSINTTTGANLGFVDITESKDTVKYEDISENARVIASASTQNPEYNEKYTFTVDAGKIYYLHIGFIRRSSVSGDISDTYTINDISYRKNIDKYLTTGDFVADGKYSFDIKDGVLISNNKNADIGVMTTSPSEQLNESTGYVKIDLSNMSGEYNLSFDSYLSTYATASIGYAVINESTKRVTKANINNEGNSIIMQESTEKTDCSSSCYYIPSKKTYETTLRGGKVYYLHFGFYRVYSSNYPTYEDTFRISNIKYRAKSSSSVSKVKVLKDAFITSTTQISPTMNIEIDLNGHKLVVTDSNMFVNDGSLTIKDSSAKKTGRILIFNKVLVENNENANLSLEGLTVKFDFGTDKLLNINYNYYGLINNKGNAIVKDSTIRAVTKGSNDPIVIYNYNSTDSSSVSSGYAKVASSDLDAIETTGNYTASHFDIENSKIGTINVNSSSTTPKEGYPYMINISDQSEIESINLNSSGNVLVENSTIKKNLNVSSGEVLMDNVTLTDNIVVTNNSKLSMLSGTLSPNNENMTQYSTPTISNKSNGTLIIGREGNNKLFNLNDVSKFLLNEGTATLYGVNGTTKYDSITNKGNLNVYNSEITSESNSVITNSSGGTVTIGDSNFVANDSNVINNSGTATILSGNYKSEAGAVYNSGTITLGSNDGTVSVESPYLKGNKCGINSTGTFNFYDGKIEGPEGESIKGNVSDRPEEYLNSSKVADGIETIILERLPIVLNQTTNTNYYSLQAAIDESSAGDTLVLLNDYGASKTITVDSTKDVEILLSGYSLTSKAPILFKNEGTLILDGLENDSNTKVTINNGTLIENSGDVNIYNLDVTSSSSDYLIKNIENGTFNIESSILNSSKLATNNGTTLKIVDTTANISTISDILINNAGEIDLLNTNIIAKQYVTTNSEFKSIYNKENAKIKTEKTSINISNTYTRYNRGIVTAIDNSGEVEFSKDSSLSLSSFNTETGMTNNNIVSILSNSSISDDIVNAGTVTSTDAGTVYITNRGTVNATGTKNLNISNYSDLNVENNKNVSITTYNGTVTYNNNNSGSITMSGDTTINVNSSVIPRFSSSSNDLSTVNIHGGSLTSSSSFYNLNIYDGTYSNITSVKKNLYVEKGTISGTIGSSSNKIENALILNGSVGKLYAKTLTIGEKDGVVNNYPTLTGEPSTDTFNYYDGIIQNVKNIMMVDDTEPGYDIEAIDDTTIILSNSNTSSFEYNGELYTNFDELMNKIPNNVESTIKYVPGKISTTIATYTIPENKIIILDLPEKIINSYARKGFIINNGILTIQGSGELDYQNNGYYKSITNNGVLNLNLVKIDYGIIDNNGILNYKGNNYGWTKIISTNKNGVINVTGYSSGRVGIFDQEKLIVSGNGSVLFDGTLSKRFKYIEINGGTINSTVDVIVEKNLLMTSGTIDGNISGYENSKIEIQSGTVKNINSSGDIYLGINDDQVSTLMPEVKSATVFKANKLYFYDGKIGMSSSYKMNVGEIIVPSGYSISTSSPYVLTNGTDTDKIVYNGVSYSNLQSAINDCSDDEQSTITLYSDITLTSDIVIPEGKNIVLDYNNHIITKGSYTVTNNGTISEVNLADGQSKLFSDSTSNSILGSIKNMLNNTRYMNIVIYEEDDGNDLLSTYSLYKYENGKYKIVNLQEDDINDGVYKLTNSESNIKLSATGGKIYINNIDSGSYKLVSESGKEILFIISDDGTLTGKIKENKGVFNNILGSSKAQLIFTIQTGQEVIKYGLLITLLAIITGLLIIMKNRKIAYKTKEN